MPGAHAETPKRRLSSEEVVELKHQLSGSPDKAELVCAHLALEIVERLNNTAPEEFSYSFVREVGAVAIQCHKSLQDALGKRYDEWPAEDMAQAEDFAQAWSEVHDLHGQEVRNG